MYLYMYLLSCISMPLFLLLFLSFVLLHVYTFSLFFFSPQPLQIKSCIAVEGLKGYIYVEAYKQQHVKQVTKTRLHYMYMIS